MDWGFGSPYAVTSAQSATSPRAPTSLTISTHPASNILSWNQPAGPAPTGYKVLRSTVSGSGYTVIAIPGNVLTYEDVTATPGTTYYYVVQATSALPLPSPNSNEVSSTIPSLLTAWYKGDSIAQADNSAISSWTDNSSANRSAVQAVGVNQPTLGISGFVSPVVKFSGTQWLKTTPYGVAVPQPDTVIVVAKFGSGSNGTDGDTAASHILPNTSFANWSMYAGAFLSGPATDSNPHIFCGIFNAASSNLRVDGGVGTTGNPGAGIRGGVTLGATADGSSGGIGYIGEYLAFDKALTVAEINSIGMYLASKYGLIWVTAS